MDNSNYMRNGDFLPNRFLAQRDALSFLCSTKKRLNPENTLGLITLSSCRVICTLTTDTTKVYSKATQVIPDGDISFCTSVAIAHLVLRNRQSRIQKPKIFIFIGSPVEDSEEELLKIARRLKKENVIVTIINFGEAEYNENKLTTFIETINGKECNSSQILTIPDGSGIQEYLRMNPNILGESNGTEGNMAADFGIDGMDDPDLAYALRISLEEQRMRFGERTNLEPIAEINPSPISADETKLNQSILDAASNPMPNLNSNPQGMTEEEQISYAINMSLLGNEQRKESHDESTRADKSDRDHRDNNPNNSEQNGSQCKRMKPDTQ